MRIDAHRTPKRLLACLARRAARRIASRGAPCALPRGAVTAICAGALGPLARRLAASRTPAHRELAGALAAAIEAGDHATALALAATVTHGPDAYAEKILSHRYRFLWICNPKAASRSLIAALRVADPEALLIRERSIDEIHARHPGVGTYFSFAFVREPAGRARSFFADKHLLARTDPNAYRWFIESWYGLRLGMSFAEFCEWLAAPWGSDAFADRHWLSQSRQIARADGTLPDFLGRYERLERDWRIVTERLGLPPTPLPRLNATDRRPRENHPPGATAVDPQSATLLRQRYAADYALGGYGDAP